MTPDHPTFRAALASVAEAGRVARAVQDDRARFRHITKSDRSPVTVADYAAQAVVAMALRGGGETVHIVGEEHAGELRRPEHQAVRAGVLEAVRRARPGVSADAVLEAIDACGHDASAARYWTLDPIDGTKGFLRGQQYAVALALIEDGEVTAAVMGCPNLPAGGGDYGAGDPDGVIFGAVRGGGAWTWPGRGEGVSGPPRPVSIAAPDPARPVRVCESVEAAHSNHSHGARVLERLGRAYEPVRLDSQCKYALVARGSADAYVRLPTREGYREKIWDHAAGMLIAVEAGARVSDATGTALDFSCGERLERNRGIVAAVPELHGAIIEAIDALGLPATA